MPALPVYNDLDSTEHTGLIFLVVVVMVVVVVVLDHSTLKM